MATPDAEDGVVEEGPGASSDEAAAAEVPPGASGDEATQELLEAWPADFVGDLAAGTGSIGGGSGPAEPMDAIAAEPSLLSAPGSSVHEGSMESPAIGGKARGVRSSREYVEEMQDSSSYGPGEAAIAAALAAAERHSLENEATPQDIPRFTTREEAIEWRRQYNIRVREERWRQKWDEAIAQMRVTWELTKLEKTNRIAAARESAHRKQLEDRIRQQSDEVEREYKNRCREVQIEKRRCTWEAREAAQHAEKTAAIRQAGEKKAERLRELKARICEAAKEAARRRAQDRALQKELDEKRQGNINVRDVEREKKGWERAQEVRLTAERQQAELAARIPSRPKWQRCVLAQEEIPQNEERDSREQQRAEKVAAKERERDLKELERYRRAAAKARQERKIFKGKTEQSLINGTRSIFETAIVQQGL